VRGHTEDEGNAHSVSGADLVGDVSEDDGDDRTTADGGDEEGSTALGVATNAAKRECEDYRKDTRLEEEHLDVVSYRS
jgi:hypothetical protein